MKAGRPDRFCKISGKVKGFGKKDRVKEVKGIADGTGPVRLHMAMGWKVTAPGMEGRIPGMGAVMMMGMHPMKRPGRNLEDHVETD